jgi:hypothetical protein
VGIVESLGHGIGLVIVLRQDLQIELLGPPILACGTISGVQEGALFSILGRHDTVLDYRYEMRLTLFQRKSGYKMELMVAWQRHKVKLLVQRLNTTIE